jgi:hypothetical protein
MKTKLELSTPDCSKLLNIMRKKQPGLNSELISSHKRIPGWLVIEAGRIYKNAAWLLHMEKADENWRSTGTGNGSMTILMGMECLGK